MIRRNIYLLLIVALPLCIVFTCGKVPIKQYYVMNYLPAATRDRLNNKPYPYTIRLREFAIEEAYNRLQIVYRQSPFQLRYYVYQVWAVKPTQMLSDLLYKHLQTANLVSNIVRRFDDGPRPEYELSGMIEAIEEYDSEELWFAHLALRINLIRLSDGKTLYTRRFDNRKRVFQHEPEFVIREMSSLMEYIFTQAIHDFDVELAKEYGINHSESPSSTENPVDSTIEVQQ